MGVRIDDIAPETLIDEIVDAIRSGRRLIVTHANAHLLNMTWASPALRELMRRSDIVYCDGAGSQLAAWLLTGTRPARHTAPEWIHELAGALARQGSSIFWLGGSSEVVERAARSLEARTGIITAGYRHGYFDTRLESAENRVVVAEINAASPDFLVVNMGMPTQERWLFENWSRLEVPVALTAGALVDHVAGRVRRPPRLVADMGLEWAVRLVLEPRRLWRRYLVGLPVFGFRLLLAGLFRMDGMRRGSVSFAASEGQVRDR